MLYKGFGNRIEIFIANLCSLHSQGFALICFYKAIGFVEILKRGEANVEQSSPSLFILKDFSGLDYSPSFQGKINEEALLRVHGNQGFPDA